MNIAEKILPGYIRRKKTELSVDDFRLFSESADRLVKIILWTVLASACILICRIDIGDTPRFAGKMAGLAAVIPFELWEMVSALRSVRPFLEKSDPSRENWTFAVVLSFLLGVLTCVVSILDVATLLNGNIETKDHEQTFVYEDIKMHVTVPEGYSEIACSESEEGCPIWSVSCKTGFICVLVAKDWTFSDFYIDANHEERHILEVYYDRFLMADKMYFKGGLFSKPEFLDVNKEYTYVAYGKCDEKACHKAIVFRFLKNNAQIVVTWGFDSDLDKNEQWNKAVRFVSDMEFK